MKQSSNNGNWLNSDLRRRQNADDVGFLAAGTTGFKGFLRGMWLPILLLLVGMLLLLVGPLPGLGAFMILGGVLGAVVVATSAWLGR